VVFPGGFPWRFSLAVPSGGAAEISFASATSYRYRLP